MLENLYSKVLESTGNQYARARVDLLKQEGVDTFLKRAIARAPMDSEEHWLAQILWDRKQHPKDFEELEKVFVEKSSLCFHSMNIKREIVSPTPYLAQETLPSLEDLNGYGSSRAKDMRAFFEAQHLPASPLWPQFLGEIAMKGWTLPPVEQRLFSGGKIQQRRLVRGPQHPTFSEDETLCHVVMLLDKLKERRARASIERLLTDTKRSDMLRFYAANVLGQFADARSLDALISIIEDNEAPEAARSYAILSVGSIGGEKAVKELQRILNTPTLKNSCGRSFAGTIEGQLKRLKKQKQQPATP